ncbi:MAG: acyltransferase [Patulibacter minatonensis]
MPTRAEVVEFWRKWRWYERNGLPLRRLAIYAEFAKRRSFPRWPLHGADVLEMLRDGRLTLGEQVHLEPNVWITGGPEATIAIGGGTFLNQGVMVSAADSITIGEHCMFANGSLITDANHRFDDLELPIPWQGFTSKGPVVIGDNVWAGANVVITSGVTIGRRTVIGANSVVTSDLPDFAICAGAPAKVLRRYGPGLGATD